MANKERCLTLLKAVCFPIALLVMLVIMVLPTPFGSMLVFALFIALYCVLGPLSYFCLSSVTSTGMLIFSTLVSVACVILFIVWVCKPTKKILVYISLTLWVIVGAITAFIDIGASV